MIIAIHRDDPDTYLPLKARFPVEEECLTDFLIFEFKDVREIKEAVRLAKEKRAEIIEKVAEVADDRFC